MHARSSSCIFYVSRNMVLHSILRRIMLVRCVITGSRGSVIWQTSMDSWHFPRRELYISMANSIPFCLILQSTGASDEEHQRYIQKRPQTSTCMCHQQVIPWRHERDAWSVECFGRLAYASFKSSSISFWGSMTKISWSTKKTQYQTSKNIKPSNQVQTCTLIHIARLWIHLQKQSM